MNHMLREIGRWWFYERIHAAHLNNVERLLFLGSSCIYPRLADQPIKENSLLSGALEPTNEWYAIAKITGIKLIQAYRKQYGYDWISAMPTNLYGPGDNYHLEDGHVVPSLIHKFHIAKERREDITIWGSGSPLREFIYSEDVARLVEILLETYTDASPVILSTSNEISIKDLVYLIADIYDYKGKIIWDTSKPEGQYRKPSDNSVIRSIAPDFKFTPIEEGLKKSIEWFIENYEKSRK